MRSFLSALNSKRHRLFIGELLTHAHGYITRATDLATSAPAHSKQQRFQFIRSDSETYPCIALGADSRPQEVLSAALSVVVSRADREERTTRQYLTAMAQALDAATMADADIISRLFHDFKSARIAMMEILQLNGFKVWLSKANDGTWVARSPKHHSDDRNLKKRATEIAGKTQIPSLSPVRASFALWLLRDCFDALIAIGRWDEENPLRLTLKERENVPLSNARTKRRSWKPTFNYINVAGRPLQINREIAGDVFYRDKILQVAAGFPTGVRLVTWILANTGARISEPISLTVGDWIRAGLKRMILCPNKGSHGARTKDLVFDEMLFAEIMTYVDSERFIHTGCRFSDFQSIKRKLSKGKALSTAEESVLNQRLLLSPTGKAITDKLYRDYYFRRAMRSHGLSQITPHYLRHEFTLRFLLYNRKHSESKLDEASNIEDFALMQGWASGADLAFYYAPAFTRLRRLDFADHFYTKAFYESQMDKRLLKPSGAINDTSVRELLDDLNVYMDT